MNRILQPAAISAPSIPVLHLVSSPASLKITPEGTSWQMRTAGRRQPSFIASDQNPVPLHHAQTLEKGEQRAPRYQASVGRLPPGSEGTCIVSRQFPQIESHSQSVHSLIVLLSHLLFPSFRGTHPFSLLSPIIPSPFLTHPTTSVLIGNEQ
jgi:hypothetical protein